MRAWLRGLILFLIVLAATLLGSFGGGEVGRRVGAARGHIGDELVFDALGSGALSALILALTAGLLAAPRLGFRWWAGLLAVVAGLAVLAALFAVPGLI